MSAPHESPASKPLGATLADPRETTDSFVALPEDVQAEVRLGWRQESERDERVERLSRADRVRGMLEAFAIVGFTELCLRGFDVVHLAAAAALAAAIGEAWWRTRSGQVGTPAIAALGWILLQAFWIGVGRGNLFALSCSTAFVAFLSAWIGMRREDRTLE